MHLSLFKLEKLLLDGGLSDYQFIKNSNKQIEGVDDAVDFASILVSFHNIN